MSPFFYVSYPGRVLFGQNALERLSEEVEKLGARRALILCTPEQRTTAERVAEVLGERAAGVYDRAVMHVPLKVAEAARAHASSVGADACVAVGGGSTIGLGKAISRLSAFA